MRLGFGILHACILSGQLIAQNEVVAEVITEQSAQPASHVVVVCGAPGLDEYRDAFAESGDAWLKLAHEGEANVEFLGRGVGATLEEFETALGAVPPEAPLWVILLGHGTFDSRVAKFNLRGADLSETRLSELLSERTALSVIINTSASSAPFLDRLSGDNRIIITATKSGNETNYARFGKFIAQAFTDPTADQDKDQQISILEAFLFGSRATQEFYEAENRLATEHALIDDNGDHTGTRAEWFSGLEVTKVPPADKKKAKAGPDGARARQVHLVPSAFERSLSDDQRERRNLLEAKVTSLRKGRKKLDDDAYYAQLEKLLVEIGSIYSEVKAPE